MASNYNRKSASSGSRKPGSRTRGNAGYASGPARSAGRGSSRATSSPRSVAPRSASDAYRAMPGGRLGQEGARGSQQPSPRLTSVRVGDLDRAERQARAGKASRNYFVRIIVALSVVVALVVGGIVAYNSSLFTIESVSVTGVEHLTSSDMAALANVPAGTTLLRVDTDSIRNRLLSNSWVQDASVNRIFPNTLELAVTERTIEAVVEITTANQAAQQWAIASDGMWLMPIPAQDSEAGKTTSPKVYEDAASVLHITKVPYGTKPEIGAYCVDENVNNALAIVSGLTTELSGQVTAVAATDPESTTLTLESGVEVVFGTAQNIRDKERVCLKIMEDNPDVVYVNVRTPDSPTWRSL